MSSGVRKTRSKPLWAVRLERARLAAGYRSATEFAGFMGLSQQRYSNYENGRREPDYQTLTQICVALKVTPNYILGVADSQRGMAA